MTTIIGEGARITILGGTTITGIHISIGIMEIIQGIMIATVVFTEPTIKGTEYILDGGANDEVGRRSKRLGVETAAFVVSTPQFFKLNASSLHGKRSHHGEFA